MLAAGPASPGLAGPIRSTHAPRDGGGWIDEADGPRRQTLQPPEQQRKVRAGQHDRVGAAASLIDEAGRQLRGDIRVRERFAAQFGLGERGEARRADQRDVRAVGEVVDELAGVFPADRGLGPEHRHPPRDRRRAGRLDRRHRPDERHAELRAQVRQHERRGGVAGDDDEAGTVGIDQFAHERDDALDQRGLVLVAVGKEGVVGDVDVARIAAAPWRPREKP